MIEKIITTYSGLSPIQKRLLDAAEHVREQAYAPYSNFLVGAALLSLDEQIIEGANAENASYGLTICAERSALVRANALGLRQFSKIAIITKGKTYDTLDPSWSCGACRQWLYEFSQLGGIDLEVITSNTAKDKIWIAKISQLLPEAFGPVDLGIDLSRYR